MERVGLGPAPPGDLLPWPRIGKRGAQSLAQTSGLPVEKARGRDESPLIRRAAGCEIHMPDTQSQAAVLRKTCFRREW